MSLTSHLWYWKPRTNIVTNLYRNRSVIKIWQFFSLLLGEVLQWKTQYVASYLFTVSRIFTLLVLRFLLQQKKKPLGMNLNWLLSNAGICTQTYIFTCLLKQNINLYKFYVSSVAFKAPLLKILLSPWRACIQRNIWLPSVHLI